MNSAPKSHSDMLPALPETLGKRESVTRSIEVNGEPVLLDELGPVVLKEDGRLGHLSNWHEMTEHEKEATLKFVAKRNAKRRKALLERSAAGHVVEMSPADLTDK